MKMRKAQAAMEFLMTYGWAILVVLAAIGALAYFGVLSPGRFLPEQCQFQGTDGFSCDELKVDSDDTPPQIRYLLRYTGGRNLENVNVTLTTSDCTITTPNPQNFALVENRDEIRMAWNCTAGDYQEGEAVEATIDVDYQFQGGQERYSAEATIVGEAQP